MAPASAPSTPTTQAKSRTISSRSARSPCPPVPPPSPLLLLARMPPAVIISLASARSPSRRTDREGISGLSQIEGAQSPLSDLLLHERGGVRGVPLEDVEEV